MSRKCAFAIAAHPDDIEFVMAGTLLLLGQAGYELHVMNVASGCCGSMIEDRAQIAAMRWAEAQESAKVLGATIHAPIADDLEIFYEAAPLKKLAATIREVQPTLVLTHALRDYMEDHMNTARLVTTALFARGMPNFRTLPERAPYEHEATLYHALPHGLRDMMGEYVRPEIVVDVAETHEWKKEALACHRSQKDWLDATQGMGSYLQVMDAMSREVARLYAPNLSYAEGWRQHSHLGFCGENADPLREALGARVHKVVSQEELGLQKSQWPDVN